MTMRRYQITLINDELEDEPLYAFTTVERQTFGEAANAAYVHRARRGLDWRIESIVRIQKGKEK